MIVISNEPKKIDLNIEPLPGDEITDEELNDVLDKLHDRLEEQFNTFFPRRGK